jgi:hypothetical protein
MLVTSCFHRLNREGSFYYVIALYAYKNSSHWIKVSDPVPLRALSLSLSVNVFICAVHEEQ